MAFFIQSDKNVQFSLSFMKLSNQLLFRTKLTDLQISTHEWHFPANIYLFKVNNRNTGKSCEICSELTVEKPERCQ